MVAVADVSNNVFVCVDGCMYVSLCFFDAFLPLFLFLFYCAFGMLRSSVQIQLKKRAVS